MEKLSLQDIVAVAESLVQRGEKNAAITRYWEWLQSDGLANPSRHVVLFNMGILLKDVGKFDESIACYQQAMAMKPDLYQAAVNMGLVYEAKGDKLHAVQSWLSAIQGDEAQTQLLNQLGRVMEMAGLLADAEKYLLRSLILTPEQPNCVQHYLYIRQKQCKWPVVQALPELPEDKLLDYCGPLGMMALTDDPARQLKTIRNWVKRNLPTPFPRLSPPQGYQHKKIRVGYMSCDFRWHAVSILTAELYELHNREQFEVYAIDFTAGGMDSMRQRVLSAMDHHLPIHHLSDEQAAQLIRQHEIDILVDLTGLTAGARYSILAYKPAPIQISYLGFVGTCGIPEVDYILADRFVFPEALKPHFVEKPLYLPKVYQINDTKREIAATPSRASCGLPEQAFVFCSFNGSYKITDATFASWLRILQAAPDSVLWLCADNQWARANLKQAAAAQGVDIQRLIFSDKVPPAEYLARYRVADLLLDTHPYNAGTTASDALWAGLPVLTCPGRAFASRMAGSLLNAMNMPELIADSVQAFEDQAVFLATHPEEYRNLRARLQQHREDSPLFDAPGLVADLEQLYRDVIAEHQAAN